MKYIALIGLAYMPLSAMRHEKSLSSDMHGLGVREEDARELSPNCFDVRGIKLPYDHADLYTGIWKLKDLSYYQYLLLVDNSISGRCGHGDKLQMLITWHPNENKGYIEINCGIEGTLELALETNGNLSVQDGATVYQLPQNCNLQSKLQEFGVTKPGLYVAFGIVGAMIANWQWKQSGQNQKAPASSGMRQQNKVISLLDRLVNFVAGSSV